MASADVASDVTPGWQVVADRCFASVRARVSGACVIFLAAWAWPLLFALLVAGAVEVPYRVAARAAGDYSFVGTLWAPHDVAQYYSAMRQGAAEHGWLIVDRFSQEPHAPALMYTFYVGLGKLVSLLGIGVENGYLAASTAGRITLLLAIYSLTGLVSRNVTYRRIATGLITLSSGAAAITALVGLASGQPFMVNPRELNDPELNTLLNLYTAPHLMFGLALLLIAARLAGSDWEKARTGHALMLAGVVVLLGLTNPFSLVPLCVVVGVSGMIAAVVQQDRAKSGLTAVVTVWVSSAPFLFYSLVIFTFDPFWGGTYGRQNITLTPAPEDFLRALGVLLPLALLGLPGFLRPLNGSRILVLSWIVLAVLLMHAPTGVQRRFGIGLHPMLGLVAVFAVVPLWHWLRRPRQFPWSLFRTGAYLLIVETIIGSSLFMYLVALAVAMGPLSDANRAEKTATDRAIFIAPEMRQAADQLAAVAGPDDVILAATPVANYLVGIVPARAYVGHWVATLNYTEKEALTRWFFDGPIDADRRQFLADHNVTYLAYVRGQNVLGGVSPTAAGVETVVSNAEISIFKVGRLGVASLPTHEPGLSTGGER